MTNTTDSQAWSVSDRRYMSRAIKLARQGLCSTHPNPRVGCVLVCDDRIIGEAAHLQAGSGHAEIRALDNAGNTQGATCYVSLEPCSHQGRTGPCADALIEAGISRVIAAMKDPNPAVSGQGLRRLQEAGIETSCGLLEDESRLLNPGFIKRMQTGRPFVRCKLGMSLDGRTAMASGESQWITSESARSDVQRLRAQSSAIITGIETVLADDPSLTVRDDSLSTLGRQPVRIVVDSKLRLPVDSKMLALDGETWVYATQFSESVADELSQHGVMVKQIVSSNKQVDLSAMLDDLGAQAINEALLEAGPTLCGAMLQQGLVDELVLYMAPMLMGADARGLVNLPLVETLNDSIKLDVQDIRRVGDDWRICANVLR